MRRRDFSGLEINGEFVLGGSLNRKIGRFMPGSETAGARSRHGGGRSPGAAVRGHPNPAAMSALAAPPRCRRKI